ncbi:MAG: DUF1624 domain-containing protein [Clostridia bacterium]|nr:DUF1624 domain-containing protein [Clostridia bacterium]
MIKNRVYFLDWIRGIAVLGMILHHGLFAIEVVSYFFGRPVEFQILDTWAFWVLQELFVAVFLLISGICTAFSKNVLRRGCMVAAAALLITLVTGLLLPGFGVYGLEIWFGILHLFGFSMLTYGLFTCRKKWVPITAAFALFFVLLLTVTFADSGFSMWIRAFLGFPFEGFLSADYYPILPYFLVFLAGTFMGPAVRDHQLPARFYTIRIKPLEWIGRHSLWIYIAHQPIIFGIIALIFYIV